MREFSQLKIISIGHSRKSSSKSVGIGSPQRVDTRETRKIEVLDRLSIQGLERDVIVGNHTSFKMTTSPTA